VSLYNSGLISRDEVPVSEGDKVFVVGCGNTAMDAARTALRLRASEVTVLYHRDIEHMSALRAEYDDAVKEGVKFMWNTSIKEIHEGTVPGSLSSITVETDGFYLVCVYTPNSQNELARLDYRMEWEEAFLDYVCGLDRVKPVIICGDLNVAHQEIDLKNPKTNRRNAGFTDEERSCMSRLLDAGFVDTFRFLHPDARDAYSWWSYRGRAREKNVGWRIDYFIVSERLAPMLTDASILADVTGSDHCPVTIDIADSHS